MKTRLGTLVANWKKSPWEYQTDRERTLGLLISKMVQEIDALGSRVTSLEATGWKEGKY